MVVVAELVQNFKSSTIFQGVFNSVQTTDALVTPFLSADLRLLKPFIVEAV